VSPILVRPVREQFEHDRVIRVLQARYKRKYEVVINPGAEQNASVSVGDTPMYPDLVLFSPERGRKLQGTIEVETGESINTLEAMAQWALFGRLRVPLFLFVPVNSVDAVRRLCAEHQVPVAEIWTYHMAADQVRFTMVHRTPAAAVKARAPQRVEHKPAARKTAKRAGKTTRPKRSAEPAKRLRAAKKTPTRKTAKAAKRR